MAVGEQGLSVSVVMDASDGQRFVDRLNRSGLIAHVEPSVSFDQQARAGQLYLIPAGLSSPAAAASARGAHVCVIPPWPIEPVAIGASSVRAMQAAQRRAARYNTVFAARPQGQTQEQASSLRLLYRERLAGEFGLTLVESDAGEPLLATLPRLSNRHGYVVVTTLQISVASAQTHLADVARLIRDLYAWLLSHSEPVVADDESVSSAPVSRDTGADGAPLVALALMSAKPSGTALMSAEDVWSTYQIIQDALGASADRVAFDAGWAWLEAVGVISPTGRGTKVDSETLERYGARWGLGPRVRRLRGLMAGA